MTHIKTASQHNAAQVGTIEVPVPPSTLNHQSPTIRSTTTDPGEAPERSAIRLADAGKFTLGTLKLSRSAMIEAVQNARHIPLVWQEVMLAEIALIPPQHDLLRLDMHRHPIGNGINVTFTIKEL